MGTYVVANWKSNKTEEEAAEFLDDLASKELDYTSKKVIICPSFTSIGMVYEKIGEHHLPIEVGGQNVSPFLDGPYTGEVNARQLGQLARYCIVGHSERRRNFLENEELINDKIQSLLKHKMTPLICVSSIEEVDSLPEGLEGSIICFEPWKNIGTGIPESPEVASGIAKQIKEKHNVPCLYGGSVDSKNVSSFTKDENIDGVLVGGASLDASSFAEIIQNA